MEMEVISDVRAKGTKVLGEIGVAVLRDHGDRLDIVFLENTEEGMFAITELSFRPSSKKGYLRGSFTLNCAYMRDK